MERSIRRRKLARRAILFAVLAAIMPLVLLVGCQQEHGKDDPDATAQSRLASSGADVSEESSREGDYLSMTAITADTTVGQIMAFPEFDGFARLLFPVDRHINEGDTLRDVSVNGTLPWYSNMSPQIFAEELELLRRESASGNQVFYPIYTEQEISEDPSKSDVGLFFFRGEENAPFAIINAGGGFVYVAALHDSFPHAMRLSESGMNAFALIYRPDRPYEDLARAIEYVYDRSEELEVSKKGYSLWGGSAGARMAATLGNAKNLQTLTGRTDILQASAVIMQYTGYSQVSPYDAPTYACVGTNDGIAYWATMQSRLKVLSQMGIPTDFHVYDGLSHGFGIGEGTVAQGWLQDALKFWKSMIG